MRLPLLPLWEKVSPKATDERLSEVSSCICEFVTRVACFCIENDEQLAGERNADDHFLLSGSLQPLLESCQMRIIFGNEKEDAARPCPTAAHWSSTAALATVIGDRRQAGQLGDGLVGEDADLRQL